jgi:hypothetical protein
MTTTKRKSKSKPAASSTAAPPAAKPIRRVIRTASGTVTLGQYVAAWKRVVANPNATFKSSLTCVFGSFTAAELRREFLFGVNDRINRHVPGYGIGRKWNNQWFLQMYRAAAELNRPRLRIYWLPADLKTRFAHRICTRED